MTAWLWSTIIATPFPYNNSTLRERERVRVKVYVHLKWNMSNWITES